MCNALTELKNKGVEITPEEETAAKIAILLHDIGHGPFSHALENILISNTHHETISILIMRVLNDQMKGQLQKAIDIFTNNYTKPFLHQLISGQLDVDRMDYLTRDSFYTGVSGRGYRVRPHFENAYGEQWRPHGRRKRHLQH